MPKVSREAQRSEEEKIIQDLCPPPQAVLTEEPGSRASVRAPELVFETIED